MTTPDLQQVKAAMAETNALFQREVYGRRNIAALDLIYTADARILPPGSPIIAGREAIKQYWAGLLAGSPATSVEITTLDVMLAGDGAVEIARAKVTAGDAQAEVKYVIYWRVERGRWKWHVDIWNSGV